MAIDDNTSYELTGYQVKDLAGKIRAKADASSLASVATSGLYSDLTGAPTIPTVYNGTLTIQQNGTQLGTFSANQSSNTTINITGGGKSPVTLYTNSFGTTAGTSTMPLYSDSGLTQQLSLSDFGAILEDSGAVTIVEMSLGYPNTGVTIVSWADLEGDQWQTDGEFGVLHAGSSKEIWYYYWPATDNAPTYTNRIIVLPQLNAGSNITIDSSTNTISATDTTYSNFTGATSSVAGTNGLVPAPASGDQEKVLHGDGTWKDTTAKLVEMSYGESNAWTKFINAYNAGSIVYCRASSNANPATGSQTRKAFMAYVNDESSPTSVEFQYVRSVSSKTSSQPVDQVFVYTLKNTNGGTWSVASRDMAPKIAAGTGINVSYSNGTYTISLAQKGEPWRLMTIQVMN